MVDHVNTLSLRPPPPLRGWMFMLGLGLVDSTRGVERHGGMGKSMGKRDEKRDECYEWVVLWGYDEG